jgi:methylmalonyl-CoA/ethylmalonyl-CoA epimerase
LRVDHVAIAVNRLDDALRDFEKAIRGDSVHIEEVPNEKVRVAIIQLEDTRIEIMEPTSTDSPITKFLSERGEGIHHLAITADRIDEDVKRASDNGCRLLGTLRTGSYGRRIIFIHPKSLHGVLTELCESVTKAGDRNDRNSMV